MSAHPPNPEQAPIPVPTEFQYAPPQYDYQTHNAPQAPPAAPTELNAQNVDQPGLIPQYHQPPQHIYQSAPLTAQGAAAAAPQATTHVSQEVEAKQVGAVQAQQARDEEHGGARKNMIACQMPRRIFWILVVVIVILIGAAIGGGVGGYKAGQKSSNSRYVKIQSTALLQNRGNCIVKSPANSNFPHRNEAAAEGVATVIRSTSTATIDGRTTTIVESITTTSPARPGAATTDPPKSGAPLPPSTTIKTFGAAATCAIQPRQTGGLSVACPSSDNCVYAPPESSERFLRVCGKMDSLPGTPLVGSQIKTTMEDCIAQCTEYNARNRPGACKNVIWEYSVKLGGVCNIYSLAGNPNREADSIEMAMLVAY